MKKAATVLLCAFVLLAFAGCNSNTQKNGDFSFHDNSAQNTQNQNGTEQNNSGQDDVDQSAADSKQEEDSKTLIAYFSRVGHRFSCRGRCCCFRKSDCEGRRAVRKHTVHCYVNSESHRRRSVFD